MLSAKIYLIIGAVAVAVLSLFGLYFWYAESRIESLVGKVTELTTKVATLETTNQEILADVARIGRATAELDRIRTTARTRAATDSRAARQRDLVGGARENPTEMQRTVNEETENAFRSLEEATR